MVQLFKSLNKLLTLNKNVDKQQHIHA